MHQEEQKYIEPSITNGCLRTISVLQTHSVIGSKSYTKSSLTLEIKHIVQVYKNKQSQNKSRGLIMI